MDKGPNKLAPLDDHTQKHLKEQLSMFYIGPSSYHLATALALSRGLDGAIRLLNGPSGNEIIHAFVELNDSDCYDASGLCSERDMSERFPNVHWPPEHWFLTFWPKR